MKYAWVTLLLVAGCSTAPTPGRDVSQSGSDACGASTYQSLIGQDAVVELSLPEPKRSYRIGDAITQDFVAERINIILDETDTILAVTCG